MLLGAGLASISNGYEPSPRSLHTEVVKGLKVSKKASRDEHPTSG